MQSGASNSYPLTSADVGRTIYCEVQASNAGGTGFAHTGALRAVASASVEGTGTNATSPGASELVYVNPQVMAEFWAHPPWDNPTPTPTPMPMPRAITSSVALLMSSRIRIGANETALVRLRCTGQSSCRGSVTLAITRPAASTRHRGAVTTLGTAGFSIGAGASATSRIRLTSAGRRLLNGRDGLTAAHLALVQIFPAPTKRQVKPVQLVRPQRSNTG